MVRWPGGHGSNRARLFPQGMGISSYYEMDVDPVDVQATLAPSRMRAGLHDGSVVAAITSRAVEAEGMQAEMDEYKKANVKTLHQGGFQVTQRSIGLGWLGLGLGCICRCAEGHHKPSSRLSTPSFTWGPCPSRVNRHFRDAGGWDRRGAKRGQGAAGEPQAAHVHRCGGRHQRRGRAAAAPAPDQTGHLAAGA
jgi:hypothetical protein